MKTKRRGIAMPNAVWDPLKELADKREVSVSELIRRAVELYLETENGKADAGKSKKAV